jgi:glycine hydroxymethyltransferase
MCDLIDARGDAAAIEAVKAKALDLCRRFPVYGG